MSTTLLLADGRNVMFPAQNPGLVDSELTADLIREINARLESEDQMLGIPISGSLVMVRSTHLVGVVLSWTRRAPRSELRRRLRRCV
jgi:hypothetical protein